MLYRYDSLSIPLPECCSIIINDHDFSKFPANLTKVNFVFGNLLLPWKSDIVSEKNAQFRKACADKSFPLLLRIHKNSKNET